MKRMQPVDAVVVGAGWAGTIAARELVRAGLRVLVLERGRDRSPREDFAIPSIRDELKYAVRGELFQDTSLETLTVRHSTSEQASPMRRLGAFLPGDGVGGAGTHWGGQTYRFTPDEFSLRSHLLETQPAQLRAQPDLTIQNWGVSYDELEPHYDRFEKLCGVSGKAGNLGGRLIPGGNIFEGPRSSEYPNAPLAPSSGGTVFARAAGELGYHPFPIPAANMSAPYKNPEGQILGQCQYCGHCGSYGCEANAKASPETTILPVLLAAPNFELRTLAYVKELTYDKAARKVSGVVYVDRRTGEECEQPADLVILASFTINNTLLLLTSKIGEPYDPATAKGVVGKNYCGQLFTTCSLFFEDREFNPFMSTGAHGMVIADFEGANFDHKGLRFVGGGHIACGVGSAGPIRSARSLPQGTPRWGSEWKAAVNRWYRRSCTLLIAGANYASRQNHLSLDPTYRDAIGRPLLRMTYNFGVNDQRQLQFLKSKADEIAAAMKPSASGRWSGNPSGNFDVRVGQTSHNSGGAIMGEDPGQSVVNRYLQAWAATNLFVIGASAFPQGSGHNPTGTLGALTYWSTKAIIEQYLRKPGALVDA